MTSLSPYSAFGTVATGERFLGRVAELEMLGERVLNGGSSAALVGLPRIGKSSLASRLLDVAKADGIQTGWINASVCSCATEVIDAISELLARILDLEWAQSATPYASFRQCKRLLLMLQRQEERIVVVFDEFDALRHWDEGARALNLIRELIHDPVELPLAGVFVSRRTLERLEVEISGISTFAGVCQQMFVGQLDSDAVETMRMRGGSTTLQFGSLMGATGGHPYLAERLLHADAIGSDDSLDDYFRSLGRFLVDENLEARLVALRSGSPIPGDVETDSLLVRYGLWTTDDGPFSSGFANFLDGRSLDLDVWSEFGRAERAVRRLLQQRLEPLLGSPWLEGFETKYRKSAGGLVSEARVRRETESKKWANAALLPLVDYTYPGDLRVILTTAWGDLALSGRYGDKRFWQDRLDTLARVRTPLGHHRTEVLTPEELAVALYHCGELVSAVDHLCGPPPAHLTDA